MEDFYHRLPPVLLQGAYVTGLFALLAAVISRSVAAGALKVQEQTLFTTMLPRRVEWQENFRAAVEAWDKQMAQQVHWKQNTQTPPEPTEMFNMTKLANDTRWLFDNTVAHEAQQIVSQMGVVHRLRIEAAGGGPRATDAANQVGDALWRAYELFTPLTDAMKPFLYVGNIKQSTKIVAKVVRVKNVKTKLAGKLLK